MSLSIEANNLSKRFKIYKKPSHRILEWLTVNNKKYHDEFWALRNINFKLNKGEALGIVGPNGAGKSTLLKLLTGSLSPTSGDFSVNGRIVSLLELGTGFHPELTGMQNIYNSTSLMGFEPDYIRRKLDNILEFAGIDDFIDQPLKTYSSGMYVRLAFSLFANLDPDIYIVDEALAVGDVFFQQKCYSKLQQMRDQGVSIILVSHDSAPIVKYCDFAMIIDKGEIRRSGNPSEIMEVYQADEYSKRNNSSDYKIEVGSDGLSYGDGSCNIEAVKMLSGNSEKNIYFSGENVSIEVNIKQLKLIDSLNVGIQIKNRFGNILYGTNTNWNNIDIAEGKIGDIFTVKFNTKLNFGPGEYTITIAATESKTHVEHVYNWRENVIKFTILESSQPQFGGEIFLPMDIEVHKS